MIVQEKTVKIALIGLGTVGTGVGRIVLANGDLMARRSGVSLELAHVVDIDPSRAQTLELGEGVFHTNWERILADDEVEIVIELIGGVTTACEVIKRLLAAGKDVVTANKALLAERGEEIYAVAREHGRCVAFEASCCGGIPLVGAIRSGLAANNISAMYGIVNGTCNYILTSMSTEGKGFEVALQEAQAAGYAEADPTLDLNGADSAHKLAILTSLAFGKQVVYEDIPAEGIEGVHLADIEYGKELGYAMKLLAITEQTQRGLSLRVHPAFIRQDEPLAQVAGSFNAMSIFGDEVGHTSYYGRGAGMMPTASAVVADVIDVARGNSGRLFDAPAFGRKGKAAQLCPMEEIVSRFYLRLAVADEPGMLAQISHILSQRKISISACLQHESAEADSVPLVITTHLARQGDMDQALADLSEPSVVRAKPVCIHIATPPVDE